MIGSTAYSTNMGFMALYLTVFIKEIGQQVCLKVLQNCVIFVGYSLNTFLSNIIKTDGLYEAFDVSCATLMAIPQLQTVRVKPENQLPLKLPR